LYVNPKSGTNVVFYYNSKRDLKSWCRAADNSSNCTWGYLAKAGAEDWCRSLGASLLSYDEFVRYEEFLRGFLPKTIGGYSYWVTDGCYTTGGKDSGRPDGYWGKGGVVCVKHEIFVEQPNEMPVCPQGLCAGLDENNEYRCAPEYCCNSESQQWDAQQNRCICKEGYEESEENPNECVPCPPGYFCPLG
jgi:hypothetical protein